MQNDSTEKIALRALREAFQCLDRDMAEKGFWSPLERTYVSSLLGERGWAAPDHRYTLFGLAGALRAHRITYFGDREHLRYASNWAYRRIYDGIPVESFYYGGLWALTEAAILFDDERYAALAAETLRKTRDTFLSSPDLNYSVGLFALSELLSKCLNDNSLRVMAEKKTSQIVNAINSRGIPATGDYRAAYHQRLMYASWGLCGTALALNNENAAQAAEKLIDFVTRNRIDEDGGIRWHSIVERAVTLSGMPGIYPYGSDLYYECHQCFYLIAVNLFHKATNSHKYSNISDRVFHWIFGKNRWHLNLTDPGIEGVPIRCISRRGKYPLALNRFKGCYEVGAYLWAMSEMSKRQSCDE